VKLAYQESEIVALLKKIPLGTNEMNTIRGRAEELREGTLCDYRPVLPLMLASFIFDVLCTPGTHRITEVFSNLNGCKIMKSKRQPFTTSLLLSALAGVCTGHVPKCPVLRGFHKETAV